MIIAWGSLMQAARRGEVPLVQFGCGPTSVALHANQPVYLATPYTRRATDVQGDWDRLGSMGCILDAAQEVRRLKAVGVSAFSPIVLSAMPSHLFDDPKDFDAHHPLDAVAWMRWCQPFLNVCAAVVVPDIEGWDHSVGIKAEVGFAISRGVPVFVYAAGDDDGI